MNVSLLNTSSAASDRRLNLLLALSAIVAVCALIGAFVAIPKILSSADTTERIDRASAVQGCRALFRVEVDDANADLQASRAELDVLTNEGLEATARGDRAALAGIVGELMPAREAVTAAVVSLRATTDEYRRLVDLSREDEGAFLAECRR